MYSAMLWRFLYSGASGLSAASKHTVENSPVLQKLSASSRLMIPPNSSPITAVICSCGGMAFCLYVASCDWRCCLDVCGLCEGMSPYRFDLPGLVVIAFDAEWAWPWCAGGIHVRV